MEIQRVVGVLGMKGNEMKKNKNGRPSRKDTINLKEIQRLASLGLTNAQLAYVFGVSTTTIDNWIKNDKKFLGAIREGKEVADKMVERSLFERAIGYTHPEERVFCHNGEIVIHDQTKHYPPDVTACIHWLKVRKPSEWREVNELVVRNYLYVENEGLSIGDLKKEAEELAIKIVEGRTQISKN